MDLEKAKKILREHKQELKEKYGVKSLSIFGSYARGEQRENSDIDIVVEFEKPIGLKFFELADYLESLLKLKVDLLTKTAIRRKKLLWKSIEKDLINV
ncbi:hypothetical protein SAMN06265339_0323 [Desulfurobacterium pacificum]|uniref:Polymerase nucleotidyl transferase domain-containing protein n=1 Tax=Desulfurobacterium pacificum TaxID=240166 RepID=A0ABY1NBQ9_9BACT|nr:nucleotidyltransferase family protein [Desulfurobacterium pacificum]SMP05804.1 hypothetical protein SAMN06265339_0323 [Desulfurobacterium pacificum]